jgi:hypothetical protein
MKPTGSTCKNLSPRARWFAKAFIVCSAVAAVSSGSHGSSPAKSTTTPESGVDALIVSVEHVRKIANADDLTPHPRADLRKPPPEDTYAPGPCRAVGHTDLTCGTCWVEFRSAGYNGVTDDIQPGGVALVNSVTQAVARYPDSSTAAAHSISWN